MKYFTIFFFLLMPVLLQAQEKPDSPLALVIKEQDSLLFERGFNQCDTKYLESVTHPELSAYYEKGEAQSRAKYFEDVQKYHCGDATKKQIRKIVPNSLETFSLYDKGVLNGAVQSGSIDLYLQEPGKPDVKTGTSKFTNLWLLVNGKWLLKEAMSFGHQE
ncbi:MAG: nuclear transport factor 2 family protein [Flavobacterium sp.]|nr:MAG: nuclear transport factor 2 family protein [Flavobacterium sp.]